MEVIPQDVLEACSVLWDFNVFSLDVPNPDLILILGSNDINVATYAAGLIKKTTCKIVVCSGGIAHTSDLLATHWSVSEAEMFFEELTKKGIPEDIIVCEKFSTNTSENVMFSKNIIKSSFPFVEKIIIIHKPFMCLRAYLTAKFIWRGVHFGIDHEKISCVDYIKRYGCLDIIDVIVGDTERVMLYPKLNYMESVHIPIDVRKAFNYLMQLGYRRHSLAKVDEQNHSA